MRAALLLTLAAPLAASAQTTADPWPLAPGNTWTYLLNQTSSTDRAFRWTVLDSVDVGSERLPRLRIEDQGTVECLVRRGVFPGEPPGTTFSLLNTTGTAPCQPPFGTVPEDGTSAPGISVSATALPRQVIVGGESLGEIFVVQGGGSDGNPERYYMWGLAERVGVLNFSYSVRYIGNSQFGFGASLRHATIGGQTIGQPLGSRADFWPLAVGNRWEFLLTDRIGQSAGVAVWTVETAGQLRLRHVENGAVTTDVTCPLALQDASPHTSWKTSFDLGRCMLSDRSVAPNISGEAVTLAIDVQDFGRSQSIGGQTVVADEASGARFVSLGQTGFSDVASYTLARGIGPVRYFVETAPETGSPTGSAGNPRRQWTASLAFARVGATTYGQQVVADESGPADAALALAAGPNPTRGALALSFSLPAPGEAAVEVVDALGRTVLRHALGARPAGAGAAQIDLSGVAPGVYVVRLAGGAARASVRVSVVR